ncbi:MAG: hypothetical protein ACI9KE_004515 [Polyangiales bacterium]|jgi:hypothetical protein
MSRAVYFVFGALVACSVNHAGLSPIDGPDAAFSDTSLDDAISPDAADGGRDAGLDAARDTGLTDTGGRDTGNVDVGCSFLQQCSSDGLSLETCSGGVITPTLCPVRCDEAEGLRCMDLDPSNGLGEFLDRGTSIMNFEFPIVADYEAPGGVEFNTDNCDMLPGSQGLHRPPGGDTQLCVLAFQDVSIDGKLVLVGAHGVAIVASGTITLEAGATIRADGIGQPGGAGGGAGATTTVSATGPHPGPNGGHVGDFDDAGGSGGGNGTPGETGGAGNEAGQPGASSFVGAADVLDPIHGGSGGGVGGRGDRAGFGGGAGGALVLLARGDIILNGFIDISGSGGRGGIGRTGDFGAGGGGGSGGSLLLETGGEIVVGLNARILASGGGGGGSADCEGNGTNGEPERPGNAPTGGVAAPGPCRFGAISSDGGAGGADGSAGPGESNNVFGSNGGGGGGGQGIVVVRASDAPPGRYGLSGSHRTDSVRLIPVD